MGMRLKRIVIAISLFAVPCFAQGVTVCSEYAKINNAGSGFQIVKEVDSSKDNLTDSEQSMIYTSMLIHHAGQVMSYEKALEIFSDRSEGSQGLSPGGISYAQLKVRNHMKTVARVTFFPGDNEYGSLYEITQNSATFIGAVSDGDISCLVDK